ncbi:MAG: Lrp/AsnC family transcriptional regulator [Candidatus Thorarchaeota archaeon]
MAAISRMDNTPQNSAVPVDDIDYSIIQQLTADPRMSFSELGNRIGRSRATARERVKKLVAQGMIDFNLMVRRDLLESFRIAVVKITRKDNRGSLRIGGCPRLLTAVGPDSSGAITIMMLGESEGVLKKCVEHFHQRNKSCISSLDTTFTSLQMPYFLTLRTFSENSTECASCGDNCASCKHYQSECYGCPAKDEQFGSL